MIYLSSPHLYIAQASQNAWGGNSYRVVFVVWLRPPTQWADCLKSRHHDKVPSCLRLDGTDNMTTLFESNNKTLRISNT